MAYPTTYDAIPQPSAGDSLSATQVLHHLLHGSASQSISAIEYTVGVTNSTATNTHDYKISALSAWATALAVSAAGVNTTATGVSASYYGTATVDPGHHHGSASLDSFMHPKMRYSAVVITTNTTATTAHDLIRTSGTLTATLPGARGSGQVFTFKDISGTAIISASGSDKIDGFATAQLTAQYARITLVDAASGVWDVIA